MPAFRAAEAARLQGADAYERMHFALLEGRHQRRKDFTDPNDIQDVARSARLDMARFQRDLADRSLLRRVAEDHALAAAKYGVFGTPTLVFETGGPFFLRVRAQEDAKAAARTFDALYQTMVEQDNVDEVKRPKPPAEDKH